MSTVKSYFYVTRRMNFIFKENAELNNTVATSDALVKWDSVTSNEQALNLIYAALHSPKNEHSDELLLCH